MRLSRQNWPFNVLLNLCDFLLDQAKAYGERAVFLEAVRLSLRIHRIAQEQKSDAMLVG
jgi:hypothetical protein